VLARRALQLAYFDGVDTLRPREGWVVGYDGLRIDLPASGRDVIQTKMSLRR
jgi:hypothetical protein